MSTDPRTAADAARTMDVLRRIVHALHTANTRTVGAFGVTAAQLFILRCVASAPGSSITGLAALTRGAPSSVSEVVSRLVAAGLLERQSSMADGRRAAIYVTAAGAHLCAGPCETVQERLTQAYEQLADHQQSFLTTVLEDWAQRAGIDEGLVRYFFEDDATSTNPFRSAHA